MKPTVPENSKPPGSGGAVGGGADGGGADGGGADGTVIETVEDGATPDALGVSMPVPVVSAAPEGDNEPDGVELGELAAPTQTEEHEAKADA